MILAALFGVILLIVLAMVLGPLARATKAPPPRESFDRAIYRDQLKELERDEARGVVGGPEAAAARLELERRLLAADAPVPPAATNVRRPGLALALSAFVIVASGALYLYFGSPNLPDDPLSGRQAEIAQAKAAQAQMQQIRSMVAKLAEQMKAQPDNVDGWLQLGRSYAVLGQSDDAAAAFAKAEALKPNDPNVMLAEADALLIGHSMADPIAPHVVDLLNRVVAIEPGQPAALWYLGLNAAQQGDFATARTDWQNVAAAMPDGSEERKTIEAALGAIKDK